MVGPVPLRPSLVHHSRRATRALALALLASAAAAQNGDRAGETQGDLPADLEVPAALPLGPAEALATLRVPPGFTVELFAAEPLVVDPVEIKFDERGRLWVVEMRGYMPDADGRGEHAPIGTIAILEDTDGDGAADKRTEFAKDLVLPRGVLPLDGGALCVLPPEIVFLRDDDGDGAFDVREVVATGITHALENPEHAVNAPTYGLDNWIHFANWDRALRRTVDADGQVRWLERRERGGGQWGLSIDEVGRVLRNTNPNPLYVDLVPSHYAVRNAHQRGFHGAFQGVGAEHDTYPRRINPGVNRGYQQGVLRDDFTLARFTAACSPLAFKGDALGPDLRGDIFVAEPTGNLVKRYAVTEGEDALGPRATSAHDRVDFLTSTDERFRPVTLRTGPDGALYVGDMYRGIIQHRIFMTTFLRRQVEARGLDAPLGQGRIWRVRRTDLPAAAPDVDLARESTAALVARLASSNAWERMAAQRLIVEFFDGEASVVGALCALVRGDAAGPMGAVHALWTLDGIGFADPESVAHGLAATDARVRAAAVEVAERALAAEGNDLFGHVARLAVSDPSARVRAHALLALGASDRPEVLDAYLERLTASAESSVERSAVVSGLEFREAAFLTRLADDEAWRAKRAGRPELLRELAACVGREGLAASIEEVVALVLDPPAEWWSEPLMAGLESTRRKGPKGEPLPIALRAMPVALEVDEPSVFAARIDEGCTWPGKPGAVPIEVPRELEPAERAWYARGAEVYATVCATCHQPHGGGQIGKAPTLRGTHYVVGDEGRLARIQLLGLGGEIEVEGETWNMEMPRFEGTDEDLAAVLTYVRRSWGNGAEPVSPERVAAERAALGGRTQPLRPDEL